MDDHSFHNKISLLIEKNNEASRIGCQGAHPSERFLQMRDWVKPDIEIEMTPSEMTDRILNNATIPKGNIELLIETMK